MVDKKNKSEKRKYIIKFPAADVTLKSKCEEKAILLYGKPVPTFILKRMNAELTAIKDNGYATHYLIASDLVKHSTKNGYPISNRGMLPSSFVSFLSGISGVNPLPAHYSCSHCHYFELVQNSDKNCRICGVDLPDKTCPECGSLMVADGVDIQPEINMGLSPNREPDIILNVAPEIYHETIEHIKTEFNEDQVFRAGVKVKWPDGSIRRNIHPGGIYIVPGDADITDITVLCKHAPSDEFDPDDGLQITEKDYRNIDSQLKKYDILTLPELGLLHDLERETGCMLSDIRFNDPAMLKVFEDADNSYMRRFGELYQQVVCKVKPQSFSDLARIDGVVHGTGTWTGNGEDLINQGLRLRNIISSRDDILYYLVEKRISKERSYQIMQYIKNGKGLTRDIMEQMKSVGVPDWYIESCKKIRYLFSRAQCIENTMIHWRLAYYWLHFPEVCEKL